LTLTLALALQSLSLTEWFCLLKKFSLIALRRDSES